MTVTPNARIITGGTMAMTRASTRSMAHLALAAALALLGLCLAGAKAIEFKEHKLSMCMHIVGVDGKDYSGTEFADVAEDVTFSTDFKCTVDPACNRNFLKSSDVICLLPGTHSIEETAVVRLKPETALVIVGLGKRGEVTLTGNGNVQILNALQTSITVSNIVFRDGYSSGSAGAVYAERWAAFNFCKFIGNVAGVHGGAVMGPRRAMFNNCEFAYNMAQFAGAVRVSDVGVASFANCKFVRNVATRKGGAVVTQIEHKGQSVDFKNSVFCLNESPEGQDVFDFRDDKHDCTNCTFDTRSVCCNGHGSVVQANDIPLPSLLPVEGNDFDPVLTRMCKCDAGWSGDYCDTQVQNHQEL
eukprot:m.59043 g.59043  ORF g.59043 m.59043 type:complete len:358 (+) comp11744_c0_seq1:2-1075(+)